MNTTLLWAAVGLLALGIGVSAENHTMDEGLMQDTGADDDEDFDAGPLIALVGIAAVVFVVAKYGP